MKASCSGAQVRALLPIYTTDPARCFDCPVDPAPAEQ